MDYFNIDFKRFDSSFSNKIPGFTYVADNKPNQIEESFEQANMFRLGFNQFCNIQNYLAESILIGGNLRTQPTVVRSLRHDGIRPHHDINNCVVITLFHSFNVSAADPKKRLVQTRRTEIKIPGKMLNQGSVFVDELDCYVMAESQRDATRAMIIRDLNHQEWDSINLPNSLSRSDPATLYDDHRSLARECIEHQDKITIRVGIDLQHSLAPKALRQLHVAVLDSYFVPFSCYKFEYDPTLGPDEFVLENLHISSHDTYRSTFSSLAAVGVIYLDHDQRETLLGKFYGLALFASQEDYVNYVHERRSQERFNDETLYVAQRSGDPRLQQEIARLEVRNGQLTSANADLQETVSSLTQETKNLRATIKERERTIGELKTHHEERMSSEVVKLSMQTEADKVELARSQLSHERNELVHREQSAQLAHRSTVLKLIADMLKSGWGILTAILGGVAAIAALCRKYNIKLVMGSA